MGLLESTWQYFLTHQAEFWAKTAVHLRLSGAALLIGILVGVTLGVLAARSQAASPWVTNVVGALRSIPSLAIMAVMLPLIGIGFLPAMIALAILAIPPILINTQAGFASVDPAIVEAARGMGMASLSIAWQVELPLALPVLIAGFRTAAVEVLAERDDRRDHRGRRVGRIHLRRAQPRAGIHLSDAGRRDHDRSADPECRGHAERHRGAGPAPILPLSDVLSLKED